MADQGALQMAFDPAWDSAVPYTVLIDAGGKPFCKKLRTVDRLEFAPLDPCLPPVRLQRLQPVLAGGCRAQTARKERSRT